MAKQIVFMDDARKKMLKGIDTLARAVEVTLGARGCAVVIQHRTDGVRPIFTRDGVTVANSIQFKDGGFKSEVQHPGLVLGWRGFLALGKTFGIDRER